MSLKTRELLNTLTGNTFTLLPSIRRGTITVALSIASHSPHTFADSGSTPTNFAAGIRPPGRIFIEEDDFGETAVLTEIE